MNRVINVCGVSKLCVHSLAAAESIHIELILRPVKCFSNPLNSIVRTDDNGASLNAPKRPYAEIFADSRQNVVLFEVC